MPTTTDTTERVKRVIRESLKLDAATTLDDHMPLVGGEYDLDSLDILLIITNLEKTFGIQIREGTMSKAQFASIGTLAEYVAAQRAAQQPA